ncbi:MAG: 4-hydroxy-3-methylbut-2-enyl diphosphate reductase [Planctomycetota bacterium]|jgi:4-hydroxy-3-methylbut-2-enyl diphosphate reductase|nr:4-hydroxy-3-methylbut-2-enyl diphosphate reductase [Planctomycetota bacterium]MDP6739073.1 4-hydroxy-3-methylbut-2-enyl diphosphate reductase [Planctomycetota bacterium]MDP6939981.1 4-hydroxy-3-methylbut-2-enyl diphosphate reductase [Planctomycetota bacterium]
MDARLANPRGFCAGVDRAIEIVKRALERYGAPVYVLHEIVHNKHVLEDLESRGTVFVHSLAEIPSDGVTIFSAHGVSDAIVREGRERGLRIIDATCPLVTKVHNQAIHYANNGREVILIGHSGHPEMEGTQGRIPGKVHILSTVEEVEALEVADPARLAYVTQTTLSVDDTRDAIEALTRRFPAIQGPDVTDICYATQNRQNAVKGLLPNVQLLLVVGSANSSNSNRLRELGERHGVPSYLVDHPDQIQEGWVEDVTEVGVTAGASAPESLVKLVLNRLTEMGVGECREIPGKLETVVFQMPAELS